MQLNIHLMSHPIIQGLCEKIMYQETLFQSKDQNMKNLGQLAIYETVRNWLKIYKINIQQIESMQDFTVPDPKESYIIIFDNLKNLSFFYEVKDMLPKSTLELISNDKMTNANKRISIKSDDIKSCTKIIIFLNKLNATYAREIIKRLAEEYKIQINQIRLTSIICKKDELIKLGHEYKSLNIYTSRII